MENEEINEKLDKIMEVTGANEGPWDFLVWIVAIFGIGFLGHWLI